MFAFDCLGLSARPERLLATFAVLGSGWNPRDSRRTGRDFLPLFLPDRGLLLPAASITIYTRFFTQQISQLSFFTL